MNPARAAAPGEGRKSVHGGGKRRRPSTREVLILQSGEEVQLVLPPVPGYMSYAARKPHGGLTITWWHAWYESVTAYLGPDPLNPAVLTGWLQPASDYPEKRFVPRVWLLPVPCRPEPNPGMQRTRCARR